jgi:hypothetical protein
LGPPKTPASARTITLPRFLTGLLQMHLATTTGDFVFTSPLGHPLRRSDFDRRVFRPAVDGNPQKGTVAGPGPPSTGCAIATRPGSSPTVSRNRPSPAARPPPNGIRPAWPPPIGSG